MNTDIIRRQFEGFTDDDKESTKKGGKRNFIFVVFTNADTWVPKDPKLFKFIVYQLEECPKTGRHHIQGFIQCWKPERWASAKAMLGGGAHVAVAMGSNEEAKAYCEKSPRLAPTVCEGVFTPGQGARTDLKEAIGKPLQIVAAEQKMTWVKYHRGLISLRDWEHAGDLPEGDIVHHPPGEIPPEGSRVYCPRVEYRDIRGPDGSTREVVKFHWDFYDYEEHVIVYGERQLTHEPFVHSIYRGRIINKTKHYYYK